MSNLTSPAADPEANAITFRTGIIGPDDLAASLKLRTSFDSAELRTALMQFDAGTTAYAFTGVYFVRDASRLDILWLLGLMANIAIIGHASGRLGENVEIEAVSRRASPKWRLDTEVSREDPRSLLPVQG